MKILYIANNVTIPGYNGGSVHAYEVAYGLLKRGHDTTVVCERNNGEPEVDMINGIKLIRLNKLGKNGPYSPFLVLSKWRILSKADFVIERNCVLGGIGKILATMWRVPYLLEVNTAIYDELIIHRNVKYRILQKMVFGLRWLHFRFSDHFIGTSENLVPAFARHKFSLLKWGVNLTKFNPVVKQSEKCNQLRESLGLMGQFVLVLVTSSSKSKGLDNVVLLLERLKQDGAKENIKLLIIGVDVDSDLYRQLKQKKLLDAVVFAGKIPYEEVEYYVALGHMGLCMYSGRLHPPYRKYGFFIFPIKALEYQSLGLPVVGPKIGNMSIVVENGVTGFLVQEDNVDEYVENIRRLESDSNKWLSMSQNAREHVANNFSWDNHVSELNGIILRMRERY